MSNDPEQEFFADGLVEDILTTLSKLSGLSVIARNSSFAYKGRAVDVRQVARELGVRYVLEGSVRKAGSRIRITAQLIDATTGVHIWAERYDRGIDDIFAVQDEITLTLATEMQVQADRGRAGAAALHHHDQRRGVEPLDARASTYYRGRDHQARPASTPAAAGRRRWRSTPARRRSTRCSASSISPTPASAGRTTARRRLRKAEAYVERALAIDPENPDAYRASAGILLMQSRFDEAAAAARKAVELGPNLPDVLVFASFVLACSGLPPRRSP